MTPDTPRASDRVCASCAGQTVGFGVVAKYRTEILWCCGAPECFDVSLRTYKMPDFEFKRLETMATELGGQDAGAYLDEIGKFSLDDLSQEEWAEFCQRMVKGYRHALHETLRDEAPF